MQVLKVTMASGDVYYSHDRTPEQIANLTAMSRWIEITWVEMEESAYWDIPASQNAKQFFGE